MDRAESADQEDFMYKQPRDGNRCHQGDPDITKAPVQRGSFWQDKLSAAKTNCQRRRGGVNCDRMVRTK